MPTTTTTEEYVPMLHCQRNETVTRWALSALGILLTVLIVLVGMALAAGNSAESSTATLNTSYQAHVAAQVVTEKELFTTLGEIKSDVKELLKSRRETK
jgi:predicted anti-sigma-YlaC factor YlaD